MEQVIRHYHVNEMEDLWKDIALINALNIYYTLQKNKDNSVTLVMRPCKRGGSRRGRGSGRGGRGGGGGKKGGGGCAKELMQKKRSYYTYPRSEKQKGIYPDYLKSLPDGPREP